MEFLSYILVFSAGFVSGFLVFRNNVKKGNEFVADVKVVAAKVSKKAKALKK